MLAAAVFGPGLTAAVLALAVAYMPYVARVLRSAAVRERSREYIAAGEVQGLSAWTICARHLVPNVAPLIVAQGTLLFAYAMVDLAAISFIGLGVQGTQADWGVMVRLGPARRAAGLSRGVVRGRPVDRRRRGRGQPARRAPRPAQPGAAMSIREAMLSATGMCRAREIRGGRR